MIMIMKMTRRAVVLVVGVVLTWELEAQNATTNLIVGSSLLTFPDIHA